MSMRLTVACFDQRETEREMPPVDLDRWARLSQATLHAEDAAGELTVSFVDRAAIAALNAEHMGHDGPTDVLSFPMDDVPQGDVPLILGDVVISPAVAEAQAPGHAGTLDDELALLIVHGILHILGHDHAMADDTAAMQARELTLLEQLHWNGPAPAGFRQTHD